MSTVKYCCIFAEMKINLINPETLQTVKNYALDKRVSPAYVYKLAKDKKIDLVMIDGVYFVDKVKYEIFPTRKE